MAESEFLDTEEEVVVTLEEVTVRVSYTTRGAEKQEDESDSVMQPLLQHKHQDNRDENHKADTQTTTDGADQKTSVPQELESAGRDQPGCTGSVGSVFSDSSWHECPICSELFDSHEDHRVTLLHCNHTLCHRCIAGIMKRAKDPGRLQCPFCRQTTPFPQWEIRRLQEESYFHSVCEPAPSLITSPGPELQAVPTSPSCCFALERQLEAHTHRNICGCCVYPSCLIGGLRLMRQHSLYFSVTALLLLFLVLLGCFLYMAVPAIMQSILLGNG
ncbi:uncharacterized protein LOC130187006 [Seriola aureovittata]|uniref:uncharacterized protein LOC130187006 n=1 Tax=Seriola aureovittata TaxID=2871759 RepID=UPI0024BE9730|nr:uncharacterized protein LOC130187006 [Seriola aureovittata]